MPGQYFQTPTASTAFAGAQVGTMQNFSGGALPWNPTPSPPPTSAAGLSANYASEYQKSLAMNQTNYQNILSGYQNLINQQSQGYQELYNSTLGTLNNAESGQKTAIDDQSKYDLSKTTSSLISRGLGNSTVQEAMASGVEANRVRRQNELTGQFAQMRAGYQSQLGQNQLSNLAGLTQAQLGFMNSVQAQYPDAGMYAQLAQQFGQADAMRGRNNSGGSSVSSSGFGSSGVGGPRLGYTPAPTPNLGGSNYAAPLSTGGSGYSMMGNPAAATSWNTPTWDNSSYFNSLGTGGFMGAVRDNFSAAPAQYDYSGGADFNVPEYDYSGGADF